MESTATMGLDSESTTQILNIIRSDVKDIGKDVQKQGNQLAGVAVTQKVQFNEIKDLKDRVEGLNTAHMQCPSPGELHELKKRVSLVSDLVKSPKRSTPLKGTQFSVDVRAPKEWMSKWLPWIILTAILGSEGIARLAGTGILKLIAG